MSKKNPRKEKIKAKIVSMFSKLPMVVLSNHPREKRPSSEKNLKKPLRNVSEYRIRVLDLPVFNTGKSVVIEVTDNKNCKGNTSFDFV